jgi:hypothetical protein
VEIAAHNKSWNIQRLVEGLKSVLPIWLCSHVIGEGGQLPVCVLANPLQLTWRWMVIAGGIDGVDEVRQGNYRDARAPEVSIELQQILRQFEMGFRKGCYEVDRDFAWQKRCLPILPSERQVFAGRTQDFSLDLGLVDQNLVFWYKLRRISYSHDLVDAHVSAALIQPRQILSHPKWVYGAYSVLWYSLAAQDLFAMIDGKEEFC